VTPDLLQRAEAAFHRIASLPSQQRTAALDSLASDDPSLHRLVLSLLSADEQPAFMLAPAPAEILGHDLLAPAASIPKRIGRYQILRVLGEGGMGIVYEALQDAPHRRVALKVMRGGIVSRELLSRFHREAQLLASLRHPGIASIFDAGWARPLFDEGLGHELPFFAMELIQGSAFLDAARTLTLHAKLDLFARVCDAVAFAHAQGIIHRDLKPSNILVDESGNPKVLDFGVARAAHDPAAPQPSLQTEAGRIIGTLGYIAPEQHLLSTNPLHAAIDQRADVYALGIILFECLTGRMPHDLLNLPLAEAARIVRDEEPTRLAMLDKAFRGDLDTIVAKAIEKDPNRRYPSAAALASDIRRFLRDEAILARPPSTLYRLRKFSRRHRALVLAASAVFLALSAGLAASLLFAARESSARRDSDLQRQRAEREAYRANIAAAMAALLADDPLIAASHLDRTPLDLRGWEFLHVQHALHSASASLPLPFGPQSSIISPPDGRPLVAFDGLQSLSFNLDPSSAPIQLPPSTRIGGIDTSRSRLAALDNLGRLSVIDLLPQSNLASVRWTLPQPRGKWPPGISPDGLLITSVEADESQVAIYDARSASELRRLSVRASFPPPAFSPDSRTLLVSRLDTSLSAFDWPSGQLLWQTPAGFQSFSADGSLAVLTATADSRSWAILADVRSGAERGRVPIGGSLAWGASRAVLRPDNAVLAVVDSPSLITLWDTRSWQRLAKLYTPAPVLSLRYDADPAPRFSAATRNGQLITWPDAISTPLATTPTLQTAPTATALSPDASLAAFVDWGSISVWDTRTLTPLWRRSIEPRSIARCAFDTDLRLLAFTNTDPHTPPTLAFGARSGAPLDPPPTLAPSPTAIDTPAPGESPKVRTPLASCSSHDRTRLFSVWPDGSISITDTRSDEITAHLRLPWTNPPAPDRSNDPRFAVSIAMRGSDLVVASFAGLAVFETQSPPPDVLHARDIAIRSLALIDPLLRRLHTIADVRDALLADTSLSPLLRQHALSLLDLVGDHGATLNSQAWSRVASPSRTPAEFARGLLLASRAAALLPRCPLVLNTLAVAQWRNGLPSEALDTIRRIEALPNRPAEPLTLIDLAIATLAAERIAHPDAPSLRARLRAARATLDPAKDPEADAFAREAGE